ncbi:MAG: NUDIX hydrolase [Kordiimonas sp.]
MPETRSNPSHPIIGVGAVVFKANKILLIQRSKEPKKGEWSLPGGAQELGETVEAAVLREVEEETGLKIKITAFIDAIDFIEWNETKTTPVFHYTLLDYSAEFISGSLTPSSDAADARFFSIDEALALPLWDETKRVIKLAASQKKLM